MRAAISEKGHRLGEDHYNAKLTNGDVDRMHELHESGWGYGRIARAMECSKSLVRFVIKGERRCQQAAAFRTVHVSEG